MVKRSEYGFGPLVRSAEHGFTLIEIMVALAVFSLAALALLRLQGVTLRTTADLDQRMLAQLVARNLAVEALTDPSAPPLGVSSGVADNGGRRFVWTRQVSRTDDQRLVRVDLSVGGGARSSRAVLSIVRRAQ